MPFFLLTLSCLVGGAPSSPGSAAALSVEHLRAASAHAQTLAAESAEMERVAEHLPSDPGAARAALRASYARARRSQAALVEELGAARRALSADPR